MRAYHSGPLPGNAACTRLTCCLYSLLHTPWAGGHPCGWSGQMLALLRHPMLERQQNALKLVDVPLPVKPSVLDGAINPVRLRSLHSNLRHGSAFELCSLQVDGHQPPGTIQGFDGDAVNTFPFAV